MARWSGKTGAQFLSCEGVGSSAQMDQALVGSKNSSPIGAGMKVCEWAEVTTGLTSLCMTPVLSENQTDGQVGDLGRDSGGLGREGKV